MIQKKLDILSKKQWLIKWTYTSIQLKMFHAYFGWFIRISSMVSLHRLKQRKWKTKKILPHKKRNKQTNKQHKWKRAKHIKYYKDKWNHTVPVLKETRGLTHVK